MKIKEIILGIAIIVLTIFVAFYGINTLFPKPEYNNFCPEVRTQELIDTQQGCLDVGGKWLEDGYLRPVDGKNISGYCDRDYTCRQELDLASKIRSRNVFFIALPLGVLIIALGAFLFGLEAVGAGLMGGGIGTLIYGSGAYWPYSENWIRFLISFIGLSLIIWLAYYFNKRLEKNVRAKKKKKKRQ